MRYLVKAKPRFDKLAKLQADIDDGTIGTGSVAHGEYERNMREARRLSDGTVTRVEICYCATPLEEEIPYWEEYFELGEVKDAHARRNCRHENGTETWACSNCDCTEKLETHLALEGVSFLEPLKQANPKDSPTT